MYCLQEYAFSCVYTILQTDHLVIYTLLRRKVLCNDNINFEITTKTKATIDLGTAQISTKTKNRQVGNLHRSSCTCWSFSSTPRCGTEWLLFLRKRAHTEINVTCDTWSAHYCWEPVICPVISYLQTSLVSTLSTRQKQQSDENSSAQGDLSPTHTRQTQHWLTFCQSRSLPD